MEDYKTSRESSKREKLTRKKDWTPPSSLDAPAAPQGYAHRWIRVLQPLVLMIQEMYQRNLEKVGNS
jgi:hypothetical protein